MIGTGIGLGLSGYRLASGPAFSPTLISGLELWLDSSDPSTLYQSSGGSLASADGDPVGQWRDKSGIGNHALQSDGTKKPSLKASVLNGKNAIRFDGTNDFLNGNLTSISTNSFSAFMVYRKLSPASVQVALASGNGLLQYLTLNGQVIDGYSSGDDYIYPNAHRGIKISNNQTSGFVLMEQIGGSTVSMFKNGASSSSNTVTNYSATNFYISSFTGSSNFYSGDFAEILIYSQNISSSDRQLIESYLNAKWSIY